MLLIFCSLYNALTYQLVMYQPVHEGPVLQMDIFQSGDKYLVASAGEDGFIHVFEIDGAKSNFNFTVVDSIHNNGGIATGLKFAYKSSDETGYIQLISTLLDGKIIYRTLSVEVDII